MTFENLNLSKIRVVSWDVDGTLFSFFRLALNLALTAIRPTEIGGQIKDLRAVLEFHRRVEAQRRNDNCKVIQSELQEFMDVHTRERNTLEGVLRKTHPRKRVLKMIEFFTNAGTSQVALSDFDCDYKLKALGLSQHFKKTYSCERIGFWKPSPIPLETIQTDFAVSPQQHLHIGDRRDTDGEACSRNGCQFLHISPW